MTKKPIKKKRPLDAMVEQIYGAARRGVQNKESKATTKQRIKYLVSLSDTENLKLVERTKAAEQKASNAYAAQQEVEREVKGLQVQLEEENLKLAGTVRTAEQKISEAHAAQQEAEVKRNHLQEHFNGLNEDYQELGRKSDKQDLDLNTVREKVKKLEQERDQTADAVPPVEPKASKESKASEKPPVYDAAD